MQECQFEFDFSYGNDLLIHFSNNQFNDRILGSTLDIRKTESTHFTALHCTSLNNKKIYYRLVKEKHIVIIYRFSKG